MSSNAMDVPRAATASVRKRTWEILELSNPDDRLSRIDDVILLTLIFLNVIAVILETVPSLEKAYGAYFHGFELFSLAMFGAEYVLRVWASVEDPAHARPIVGRLRFMVRPMTIIDLLAILPGVLSFGAVDLRVLRGLRLFRLLRVAKASRYVAALTLFKRVVKTRREELILTTLLMLILLIFAASAMYFAESEVQPDKFTSIPASMWWAVSTLTTVGYGDVYPITPLGKLAASFVAILGLGFFALPTAIIGSGFVEAMQERREKRCCPHCGNALE